MSSPPMGGMILRMGAKAGSVRLLSSFTTGW